MPKTQVDQFKTLKKKFNLNQSFYSRRKMHGVHELYQFIT